MLTLYDDPISGNGYKVRVLLAWLQRPYRYVPLDITRGESRTAAFLAMNPNGKVPLLAFDDGRHLAESDAILCYLAEGTPWLPEDPWARAQVLHWLFFEQYSHEPNVATPRFWLHQGGELDPVRQAVLAQKQAQGRDALAMMDAHLADRPWFVGASPTVADIALYAYTHVADEGGFDLAAWPAVLAWLARMAALPGMFPITRIPPPYATL